MSIQKLHYENLGGMLIRREGLLNWRCPLCKAEGQSPEVMRTCPECGSKEATLPGAQPAPSFADAYQGAMEDVAIWKKRALEAEDLNRKFVAEINGPAYTCEPAQPAQPAASVPVEAIGKMLADAMAVAVSNGANSVSMPDEYVEVAVWLRGNFAAPSVPEGFSREELEAVAAGLDTYEKTVNVGNVTGEGDDHLESTTAYAARFIRAMLTVAPEVKL